MKAPYYEVNLAIKTLKELRILLEFIEGFREGEIELETVDFIEEQLKMTTKESPTGKRCRCRNCKHNYMTFVCGIAICLVSIQDPSVIPNFRKCPRFELG